MFFVSITAENIHNHPIRYIGPFPSEKEANEWGERVIGESDAYIWLVYALTTAEDAGHIFQKVSRIEDFFDEVAAKDKTIAREFAGL